MALQALALYASIFSGDRNGVATVTVTYPGGQVMFTVNWANRLLYQEKELENAVGQYQIAVTGSACAVVQVCGDDSTSRSLS